MFAKLQKLGATILTKGGKPATLPRLNARTETTPVTDAMKQRIYQIAVRDVELYIRGTEYAERLIRDNA